MIIGKLQNCRYRRQVGGGRILPPGDARTYGHTYTHAQADGQLENHAAGPVHKMGTGTKNKWAISTRIRYDTIRDAILTCAEKLTRGSLIYRTEPKTKKWKTDKNGSIGKQSGESVESVLKRTRKATVGRICRKFGPEYTLLHAYMVAQKVVHFSTHHIFGIVQEKRNGFSPKCPRSFWKQKLRCSFYVNVKYSL